MSSPLKGKTYEEIYEKDIKRQNLIENKLACKFLRIKDSGNICVTLDELKNELKKFE